MDNSRRFVFAVLFSALISVCAFFTVPIPFSPIPIVLQNMMAVLSGQILGSVFGGISVLVFLAAGALGLPVFSGGGGGLARFASPTGGFLIGYVLAAVVSGLFFKRNDEECGRRSFFICVISSFCGFSVMYVPGVLHFMKVMDKSLNDALAVCLVPFIVPDFIKIALASVISYKTGPAVDSIVWKSR